LEAFSDGVFCHRGELLVLEIGIPESGFGDLWQASGSGQPLPSTPRS
jgi:hypothetical protein